VNVRTIFEAADMETVRELLQQVIEKFQKVEPFKARELILRRKENLWSSDHPKMESCSGGVSPIRVPYSKVVFVHA
jgi:hypothetical protein